MLNKQAVSIYKPFCKPSIVAMTIFCLCNDDPTYIVLCCFLSFRARLARLAGRSVRHTHARRSVVRGAQCPESHMPNINGQPQQHQRRWRRREGAGSSPLCPKNREREGDETMAHQRAAWQGGREKGEKALSHIDGRLGECGFLLIFAIIHVNPLSCGYFEFIEDRLGEIWPFWL